MSAPVDVLAELRSELDDALRARAEIASQLRRRDETDADVKFLAVEPIHTRITNNADELADSLHNFGDLLDSDDWITLARELLGTLPSKTSQHATDLRGVYWKLAGFEYEYNRSNDE